MGSPILLIIHILFSHEFLAQISLFHDGFPEDSSVEVIISLLEHLSFILVVNKCTALLQLNCSNKYLNILLILYFLYIFTLMNR